MRKLVPLLLIALAATGCRRPPMVMPTMFEAGLVDPLGDVHQAEQTHEHTIFFATDRVYNPDAPLDSRYTRLRSDRLDLGKLTIQFGKDADAWPAIVAATRDQPGGQRFRPELTGLERLGQLARPTVQTTDPPNNTADPADVFIAELQAALQRSPGKEITLYIHGFKNGFTEAALVVAEYDLYTGGLGPFVLYSWPSYDSIWEYSHDRDSVRYTTGHARRFVEMLSQHINDGTLSATKINLMAHSSGAEVAGSIVRELALKSSHLPPDQRRKRWPIGSVLLIAPDISTAVARERVLKEDIRGMYDQMAVYSSRNDRALRWAARILYRTPRIGSLREDDLTDDDRYWMKQSPNVAIIDTDSYPYNGFINHSHHRYSPATISDIILSLRTDLPPQDRGLVRDNESATWGFAEDYDDRVTRSAIKAYDTSNQSP